MKKYRVAGDMIQNTETSMFISKELTNPYYVEYVKWTEEGNTADPEHTVEQRRQRRVYELEEEATLYIEQHISEKEQRYILGQVTFLLHAQTMHEDPRFTSAKAKWLWLSSVLEERDRVKVLVATSDDPASEKPTWPAFPVV